MAHGSWLMAHGPWLMAHGSWLMAHGPWLMAHGSWLMPHGSIILLPTFQQRGKVLRCESYFWKLAGVGKMSSAVINHHEAESEGNS